MLWLFGACEPVPEPVNPEAPAISVEVGAEGGDPGDADTSGDTSTDSGGDTSGDSGEDTGVSDLLPRFGAVVPAETATAVWSASVG